MTVYEFDSSLIYRIVMMAMLLAMLLLCVLRITEGFPVSIQLIYLFTC